MTILSKDSKNLLIFSFPLIFGGLLKSSVYFLFALFLAHVSADALASGALASTFFVTFNIIIFGTLSSINILVAHLYGAADNKSISLVLRDGFLIAFAVTIPSFIFFWYSSSILLFFGQNKDLTEMSESYFHALSWGILPNLITMVILEFMIGIGHTRVFLIFSFFNVLTIILFGFCLIFGKYGFPCLGVSGAGWGTTIGYWITAIFLIYYFFMNNKYRQYSCTVISIKKTSFIFNLLQLGIPMGIMYFVEMGFFYALILIVGSISVELLAANQIVLQYVWLQIPVMLAIAQAITVLMGHALGRGDRVAAMNTYHAGAFISICFMLLVGLIYSLFPEALIALDFDINNPANQKLIQLAIQLFAVCALFQLAMSARVSLFGALRAFHDTRFTLYVSIISLWGIALPLGYLMAVHFNLGGVGLWLGISFGMGSSVLLLFWRLKLKIRTYASPT